MQTINGCNLVFNSKSKLRFTGHAERLLLLELGLDCLAVLRVQAPQACALLVRNVGSCLIQLPCNSYVP